MERDPGEAGQECLSIGFELVVFLFFFGLSLVFRSYFAFANACISLPSQKLAFLPSTPLHPPWLPLLEEKVFLFWLGSCWAIVAIVDWLCSGPSDSGILLGISSMPHHSALFRCGFSWCGCSPPGALAAPRQWPPSGLKSSQV